MQPLGVEGSVIMGQLIPLREEIKGTTFLHLKLVDLCQTNLVSSRSLLEALE